MSFTQLLTLVLIGYFISVTQVILSYAKKQHLNGSHGACAVWIDRIQKGGLKPLFLILKRYNTYTQSLNGEKFWIETFKSQGVNLANKENPALNFPACAGKPWTAS